MKDTRVAICRFLAKDSSPIWDSSWMRRQAEIIETYPIESRRHVHAMRGALDATVRNLRRQLSLGRWSQRSYDSLASHLRSNGLIDIATWVDSDAERIHALLDRGEIRTVAELRLATEYRDFVDDPQLLDRVNELIAGYEARRGVRVRNQGRPRSPSRASTRQLSSDELAFVGLLKRSAIAAYEYAAARETRPAEKRKMRDRGAVWRTLEAATQRELKGLEDGFWVSMSKLRRNRLSEREFRTLSVKLKADGLIDISDLLQVRTRTS
jgi:hypothetical protein